MRRLRMVCAVGLLIFLSACGEEATSSNSLPKTDPTKTSKAFSPKSVAVSESGLRVSQLLTPQDGGSLTANLPNGVTATLTIPADALESRTLISLVPLATANGVGVQLEPSGLWLNRNATLSFSQTVGTIWGRIAAGPDTDGFVPLTKDQPSVGVTRFRPFLLTQDAPTEVESVNLDWNGDIAPGLNSPSISFQLNEPDGFDSAAYFFENPGAPDEPRDQARNDAVRSAAVNAVAAADAKCDDRTSAAASRVADLAATAGQKLAAKPTCVRRVLSVTALLDGSMSGEGMNITFNESITGHGIVTATTEGATSAIPLEGTADGVQKLSSLMATGIGWAFGTYAGLSVAPPSADACSMSPLTSGQMNVSATLVNDSDIAFRLTPSGEFIMNCGDWGNFPAPPMIWDLLSEFGLPVPISLTVPDGQNSVRTIGELLQSATQNVQTKTNGSITVSESNSEMSLSLIVGVFWSRADRCDLTAEERAKGPAYEQEMCGRGPA